METSHYRTLARRILGSVDDHRADSKTLWAVYGFAFEISDRYRLQRADLVPGRLRFLFQDGRRAWLRVERWAAASQWMKGTPLERMPGEWLKASRFAPRDVIRQEAFAHRGHDAVRFECSVRGTMLREVRLAGIVWLCRPEDRMYAVAAVDAPDGELDAVAEATRCT
ncbi:MAG: hypothetical protein NTU83_13105 [Candidatus Hydrogenedentes bacterium]|nr:hypothetical protein [Candidatus Hydrogenedentota bacterium]